MKKERCHLWREARYTYQPALILMVAGIGQTLLCLPEGKLGFVC